MHIAAAARIWSCFVFILFSDHSLMLSPLVSSCLHLSYLVFPYLVFSYPLLSYFISSYPGQLNVARPVTLARDEDLLTGDRAPSRDFLPSSRGQNASGCSGDAACPEMRDWRPRRATRICQPTTGRPPAICYPNALVKMLLAAAGTLSIPKSIPHSLGARQCVARRALDEVS